eukprot:CAMPEP_0176406822 /NCGR_PEP_ID=MMETSP0127-20121128/1083_1 /TAXON_ID=938130 /ORGANISM="Platyophrya macrostoma, Strain WH" /LENGTH=669 /DNA_ID=CAMNT_0017785987 /DNA_START=163 /DNA_END=2172 /DNA_ORIENTATION=-
MASSSWPIAASMLSPLSDDMEDDDGVGCLLLLADRPNVVLALSIVPGASNSSTTTTGPSTTNSHVDHECLSFADALGKTCACKEDTLRATLGVEKGTLTNDAAMHYFCRFHTRGDGSIGAYQQRDAGEFAFYLDRSGGKSVEEIATERRQATEAKQYGRPLPSIPPVTVAVVWTAEENGAQVVGIHFLTVDLIGALLACASSLSLAPGARRAAEISSVSTVGGIPTAEAESLCAAFSECRSIDPARGIVLCSLTVPPFSSSDEASNQRPFAVNVRVRIRVHSWSPLPLRIEITARCPQDSGRKVLFTGRTRRKWMLLPNECVDVDDLVANCHVPGLINMNGIQVQASACRYSDPHDESFLYKSGSAPPPCVLLLDSNTQKKVAVLGTSKPLLTLVHFTSPTGLAVGPGALQKGETSGEAASCSGIFHPTLAVPQARSQIGSKQGSSQSVHRARGTSMRGQNAITLGGSTVAVAPGGAGRQSLTLSSVHLHHSGSDSTASAPTQPVPGASMIGEEAVHATVMEESGAAHLAEVAHDGCSISFATEQVPDTQLDRLPEDDEVATNAVDAQEEITTTETQPHTSSDAAQLRVSEGGSKPEDGLDLGMIPFEGSSPSSSGSSSPARSSTASPRSRTADADDPLYESESATPLGGRLLLGGPADQTAFNPPLTE